MTYQIDDTLLNAFCELLDEYGFDGLAEAMTIMLNEMMKLERVRHLQAAPYEPTEERCGYANGFKPKAVRSRVGELYLAVPQGREGDFCPSGLEKGLHSVRTLKVALAEMYVQGVSTRKVAEDLRTVFNAPNATEAQRYLDLFVAKYRQSASDLAQWVETAIPEGLTVFASPQSQRRRLRTSSILERLSREIKRRTRVATLFPNPVSCLRLVTALVMEISDEWHTGRRYLTFDEE